MKAIMVTPSGQAPLDNRFIAGLRQNIEELDRKLAAGLLVGVGRAVTRDITGNIRAGRTPDGGRQKANSPTTFMWKQHRGVSPNVPLHDTGVLINPANYRVNLARQGRAVEVSLPASRVRVADKLAAEGYIFFSLPLPQRMEALVDEVLDTFSAADYFRLLDLFDVR